MSLHRLLISIIFLSVELHVPKRLIPNSYRKNSIYWDRWAMANSAGTDQTALKRAVGSMPTLF
ncbi:MAG: hypothetical protein AB2693_27200, partial [Candidatus Thiodiazotropha sp.]